MDIKLAKYTQDLDGNNNAIKCVIDGKEFHVPMENANCDYIEIMRQVEAGELTIAPADEEE